MTELPKSLRGFDVPLICIDTETTGVDTLRDKIVELAIVRLDPNGGPLGTYHRRFNPGRPIPIEASAIHGISDADVKDAPKINDVADEIMSVIEPGRPSILVGFNIEGFDLPILRSNIVRSSLAPDLWESHVVDVLALFRQRVRVKMPHDLGNACRYFEIAENAIPQHNALGDAQRTLHVLAAMLEKWTDLNRVDGRELSRQIDRERVGLGKHGKLVWWDESCVIGFGKHFGTPLQRMVDASPDYLRWILSGDFDPITKRVVQDAMRGTFPVRAAAAAPLAGEQVVAIPETRGSAVMTSDGHVTTLGRIEEETAKRFLVKVEIERPELPVLEGGLDLYVAKPITTAAEADVVGQNNAKLLRFSKALEAAFGPAKSQAHGAHKQVCKVESAEIDPVLDVIKRNKQELGAWATKEQKRVDDEAAAVRKREDDERIARAAELEASGHNEEAVAVLEAPTPTAAIAAPVKIAGVSVGEKWTFEVVDLVAFINWCVKNSVAGSYLTINDPMLNKLANTTKSAEGAPDGIRFKRETTIGTRTR